MGPSEYLIADTDRILGTLRPPGTMHKSDQLSVLAKKKVVQTEQSGVWNHCANVASREISSSSSRRLGGCWSVSCSKLQFLQTDKLKLLTGPPEHRPGIRIVGIFADLVFGCGGDRERGSVSVFTNIATNLVRSWLRIGLEDDNILIGRS